MTVRKILLIEDDVDDQAFFNLVLREILPEADCKIVSNGIEGVEALKEGIDPEIIFLDLNMPQMDGYEFMEAYNLTSCSAPVVVVTTSSDPFDIDKSEDMGARGFISKPTDFTRLKEALRNVFNFDFSLSEKNLRVF